MKKYLYSVLALLLIVGCDKSNEVKNYKITDGIYMGKFVYKGENYWYEIAFENNKYEEFPSGGVIHYQKEMSCLTVGKASVVNETLSFKADSLKFKDWYKPCDPDLLLPGNYYIRNIINNDSIIFSRGSGSNEIIYYLKKLNF
jgi:phage baseplate assembly protein gpV